VLKKVKAAKGRTKEKLVEQVAKLSIKQKVGGGKPPEQQNLREGKCVASKKKAPKGFDTSDLTGKIREERNQKPKGNRS